MASPGWHKQQTSYGFKLFETTTFGNAAALIKLYYSQTGIMKRKCCHCYSIQKVCFPSAFRFGTNGLIKWISSANTGYFSKLPKTKKSPPVNNKNFGENSLMASTTLHSVFTLVPSVTGLSFCSGMEGWNPHCYNHLISSIDWTGDKMTNYLSSYADKLWHDKRN